MTRNNFLKTALFLVLGAVAGCGTPTPSDVVQVTFDVSVPANTPVTAGVNIIGNHANLGNDSNDAGLKLRRDSATKFKGTAFLPKGSTILYRVRQKTPDAAELNAAGSAMAPRTLTVGDQDATESITVAQWDQSSETVHPKVNFVVNVPSNTPAGDTVYIAGNQPEIGSWNDHQVALTKGGDGKYRISLTFAEDPGTGIEFKFVRGDFSKNVEKAADGSELSNRTLTLPAGEQTVELTVARWADLGAP